MSSLDVIFSLAQAGGAAPGGQCGAMGGTLPMMVLMFGIFYFIIIRPQQKRQKEHAAFLNNLKKGDKVITRGGIVGTVTGVADQLITIEVQEKVRVQVLKSFIEGAFTAGGAGAAASSSSKSDKPSEPATTESKS